jgi:hypothetical protein
LRKIAQSVHHVRRRDGWRTVAESLWLDFPTV